MHQLNKSIIEAIQQAQNNQVTYKQLYTNSEVSGKNEYLFFIKPEITLKNPGIQLEAILNAIWEKFNTFNINSVLYSI